MTPNTYACDEDTELYNQLFDISKSNHKDCKGAKPFTGGCVALDQEDIKTILTTCDKGMRVVVNDRY